MIVLLLIIMITLYLICNSSSRYVHGGNIDDVNKFSIYFEEISPTIDRKKLVYNRNPQKYNYDLIRQRLTDTSTSLKQSLSTNPDKSELYTTLITIIDDTILTSSNQNLPLSISTTDMHQYIVTIVLAARTYYSLDWLTPNPEFKLYLNNILNDIDYSRADEIISTVNTQLSQINQVIRCGKGDAFVVQTIYDIQTEPPDTYAMVEGLRHKFYNVRNAKPNYLKDASKIKKDDYERLLQEAKQVGIDLKQNKATQEQMDKFKTIHRRIEESANTD